MTAVTQKAALTTGASWPLRRPPPCGPRAASSPAAASVCLPAAPERPSFEALNGWLRLLIRRHTPTVVGCSIHRPNI